MLGSGAAASGTSGASDPVKQQQYLLYVLVAGFLLYLWMNGRGAAGVKTDDYDIYG